MKKLGVGIIGLHHLHPMDYLLLFEQIPQTEVVALADQDEDLLSHTAGKTGISGHTDWSEVLRRDDVDLVAIFLPHSECPEVAVKAAQSGKHIIVEKPMASSADGARRMVGAAAENNVKLTTPYIWRYHAVSREMKRLIREGALGEIVACGGRCAAGGPWRYIESNSEWMIDKEKSGGGPMMNLGVHWIDLFRWLLGDEVVRVSGEINSLSHGLEIEDNSLALLKFSRGAVATLDISYSVPPSYPDGRDLYIGLRGTLGVVSWSPAWGGVEDELIICSQAEGYRSAPLRKLTFSSKEAKGYGGVMGLEFMREFVRSIVEDEEPAIRGEDGVRALEIVEAIYRSGQTGRSVEV